MGLKKLKKYLPTSLASLLLFGVTGLFAGFPGRYIAMEISPILVGYIGGIFIFVVINFFLTGVTDPGTYPKRTEPEDDEDELRAPVYVTVLIHDISVRMKWCSTCNFYRPPRVSHCSVCNNCIEKFDHHCPWVNNCIGRRNYNYFFWFLALLSVHMINVFAFSLWAVILTNGAERFISIFGASISVLVIDGLLFFPVFGLFAFHVSLVVRGRTTNEQVTGKFRSGVNPFDDGCGQNCFQALCSPQIPKFLNRRDVVDYAKYTISPPYSLDRDNISIHDINVYENGKNSIPVSGAISSPQVPSPQRKLSHKSENVESSNVPEVKVIPRNGSVRQELDPNRFRAKVTPVQVSETCQPADAIAYACMDALPNVDDNSDSDRQNFEMTVISGNGSDGSPKTPTLLMKHNGDSVYYHANGKPRHDSSDSAGMNLQSGDSADSIHSPYRSDAILYDNFVMPANREKTVSSSPEKHVHSAGMSELKAENTATYMGHPSPPGSKQDDPLSNTNNSNNMSPDFENVQSLSEACESGYSSTYTEQPLKDEDISNKIELENAMRDIEANVALLQVTESSESLKTEATVTSQKARKRPEEKRPLLA